MCLVWCFMVVLLNHLCSSFCLLWAHFLSSNIISTVHQNFTKSSQKCTGFVEKIIFTMCRWVCTHIKQLIKSSKSVENCCVSGDSRRKKPLDCRPVLSSILFKLRFLLHYCWHSEKNHFDLKTKQNQNKIQWTPFYFHFVWIPNVEARRLHYLWLDVHIPIIALYRILR